MSHREKEKAAFARLLDIMDELREKCLWDRKQTMQSLRHLSVEEIYELSEAILQEDYEEIKKELGDILLHIVFYSRIASENGRFSISEVIEALCEKLIIRHPHVYGEVQVKDEEEVKANWEKIKLKEGNRSVLSGVPASLPPLLKAYRMQEKAKGVGFEWEKTEDVMAKVEEEWHELKQAIASQNKHTILEELGDLLFSLVNLSRFIDINPDDALEQANRKFEKRFRAMEEAIQKSGRHISQLSLSEMDIYWNEVKKRNL